MNAEQFTYWLEGRLAGPIDETAIKEIVEKLRATRPQVNVSQPVKRDLQEQYDRLVIGPKPVDAVARAGIWPSDGFARGGYIQPDVFMNSEKNIS